jgi:hypothetical protein
MSQATDEIAAAAARMVVEDGLEYGAAKRRAARDVARHGGRANRSVDLPSNEQVEDEVRAHIELFFADEQPAELRALRELALAWMRRLAEFRPHLAGAAWRGTATRLSALRIELYADDGKAPEIALINAGVDYDVDSLPPARGGREPLPVLTVASRSRELGEPVTVHLIVHDRDDLRGALKPDADGQTWRGDAAALRQRLAAEAA